MIGLLIVLLIPSTTLASGFVQIKDITFDDEINVSRTPKSLTEIKIEEESEILPYSSLSVSGNYGFYRIKSTDKISKDIADLNSDPSLGIDLSWKQHWSEGWQTGLRAAHQSISFTRFGNGNLTNKKISIGDIELFSESLFGDKFSFRLSVGQKTIPIIKAASAGVATIETPTGNYAGAALSAKLIKHNKLNLGLYAGYNSIFGQTVGNYKLEQGYEYMIGPTIMQKTQNARLELSLLYLQQDLETSITTQQLSSLSTRVGVTFEIGK